MKEIGLIASDMEKELLFGQTDKNMKANGWMTIFMDQEYIFLNAVITINDNSQIKINMENCNMSGQTV